MCAQMSDLVFESEPRVIGHGFKFTEGPLWHPNGFLLFTDIPANTVYRWEAGRTDAGLSEAERERQRADLGQAGEPAGLRAWGASGVADGGGPADGDRGGQLRRQEAEQPERHRVPFEWADLFHRPALRD